MPSSPTYLEHTESAVSSGLVVRPVNETMSLPHRNSVLEMVKMYSFRRDVWEDVS